MQIFYIISLNLPRSFLRPDVFIKKYGFLCIRFRGPTLSQLLVYLILQSFKNIPKFKSMCLCVCVCVCVCVCICVCVYKCDKSKQSYSCHTKKHKIAYYISKCEEISKVHKLKVKKNVSLIQDTKLYLPEMLLHLLVD